jgi:thiol-disulfide isomerase/thioredoxin
MQSRLLSSVALMLILVVNVADAAKSLQKPLAVFYTAEWCSTCRAIKPNLAVVEKEFGDRVEFVMLDKTDDAHLVASEQRSVELGIHPLYAASNGTGWVALVNRKHEQVGRLDWTMSVEQMRSELTALADNP